MKNHLTIVVYIGYSVNCIQQDLSAIENEIDKEKAGGRNTTYVHNKHNYQCQEKNHFHNNKKDDKSENACVHMSAKPPV